MRNFIETFRKKLKIDRIFKIDKSRSKSLYDVLRPINILNIIFGIRVFAIPRGHSRPILSFIYSMLYFILNFAIWRYRENNQNYLTDFEETVNYVLAIINLIELFIITMMGLHHTESLKLYAKKINEIDRTLEALGSSSSFDKIYRKTIMEITLFIFYAVILITEIALDHKSLDPMTFLSPLIYLCSFQYFYVLMVEFLLVIEFCTMVRCIKLEFQRANDLLSDVNILPISSIASELIERSLPNDTNKSFKLSSSLSKIHSRSQVETHKINRSRKLLRTIRQVHLELYRISKSFSKMYGIQISLHIAMYVFFNTHVLYILYEQFSYRSYNVINMDFQLIPAILVCLQYSIRIFVINYICDRTTEEAERTNEIIHTFYGRNTDLAIRREVEIFSMQMMQCHTTYSAFGLYNFGCKHVCSCIGIITTYVVIMVQVGENIS